MNKIILTNKFKRQYSKAIRRNPQFQNIFDNIIFQLENDIFAPSLKTHKLSGDLDGLYACKCGYDCRILFEIFKQKDHWDIVLLSIGTHNEIY